MKHGLNIISLLILLGCNSKVQKKPEEPKQIAVSSNHQVEFPFDTILAFCLENPDLKGETTAGTLDCYYNASLKLDTLVVQRYENLYSKLDTGDRKRIKKSQQQWTAFYQAESDFLYSAYFTWANKTKYGHGREHSLLQAEWKYDLVRKRLIDLSKYDAEITAKEHAQGI